MNILDQMQADVFSAVCGPMHGRSAMGYVDANDNTGFAFYPIVAPDAWKSVYDTGTDSIDFDAFPALFGANEVVLEPQQVGRGSTGFRVVFDEHPGVTWYVRNVGASSAYAGAYYNVTLTNYNGPINGV